VTYASEFNAQFAKEAMACQSLDNDEILNVRWATEDPNPQSKIDERLRLEEEGQKAIRERMDPRIVEAMRSIRALEDGDSVGTDGQLLITDGEADDRPSKRRRLAIENGGDADEDVDDDDDEVEQEETLAPPVSNSGGLLSADTLEGLKYFAQIRQQHGGPPVKAASNAPAHTLPAGMGLAEYGSDDDD
jgi:hypothetical protein